MRNLPQGQTTAPSLKPSPRSETGDPEELALVARCLNQENAAWSELQDRYSPDLIQLVERNWSGQLGNSLAEEVVTDVIHSLWVDQGALLRKFDPSQGNLFAYLRKRARDRLHALWRKIARSLNSESVGRTVQRSIGT